MATRPRWLAELLAPFEADENGEDDGEDDDATRRADRWPAGRDDDGLSSGASPLVDVVLEEPSAALASAELAGTLLRLGAPSTPARPPPEHLRTTRVWDTSLRGEAAVFRDNVHEAYASFSGEMTLSQLLNEAASVCENSDGTYHAYTVTGVSVFLRQTGVKRHASFRTCTTKLYSRSQLQKL